MTREEERIITAIWGDTRFNRKPSSVKDKSFSDNQKALLTTRPKTIMPNKSKAS